MPAKDDDHRKKISKGVLDMKFMQKTKQRLQKSEKRKIEEELKRENFPEDPEKCGPTVEFCNDITELEKLKFGRMSFKGFNTDVEKLMIYYERLQNGEDSEEEEDEEVDVQDKEMAETLGGDIGESLRKKFTSKAERLRMMENMAKGKLNFDPATIRKRTVLKTWAEESPANKFMKPDENAM